MGILQNPPQTSVDALIELSREAVEERPRRNLHATLRYGW